MRPSAMQPEAKLHILDLRHIGAHGTDPVDMVDAIDQMLPQDGMTEVITLQQPLLLNQRLSAAGYAVESRMSHDLHITLVARGRLPVFEDLTDLEPPLPLERVLEACATLRQGDVYTAWLPRRPLMLFAHLDERGLAWEVQELPGNRAALWVKKP